MSTRNWGPEELIDIDALRADADAEAETDGGLGISRTSLVALGLGGLALILAVRKYKQSHPNLNPVGDFGTEDDSSGNGRGEKLYEDFHGNAPTGRRVKVNLIKPGEKVVAIGKLKEIVYVPYGSSKRKGDAYSHEAGDTGTKVLRTKSILVTDVSGKKFGIIPDKKMHFSKEGRGIIG